MIISFQRQNNFWKNFLYHFNNKKKFFFFNKKRKSLKQSNFHPPRLRRAKNRALFPQQYNMCLELRGPVSATRGARLCGRSTTDSHKEYLSMERIRLCSVPRQKRGATRLIHVYTPAYISRHWPPSAHILSAAPLTPPSRYSLTPPNAHYLSHLLLFYY